MVKLQYDSNGQYKITLPKAIIEAKGWKRGDNITIILDDKGDMRLHNKNEKKRQ